MTQEAVEKAVADFGSHLEELVEVMARLQRLSTLNRPDPWLLVASINGLVDRSDDLASAARALRTSLREQFDR